MRDEESPRWVFSSNADAREWNTRVIGFKVRCSVPELLGREVPSVRVRTWLTGNHSLFFATRFPKNIHHAFDIFIRYVLYIVATSQPTMTFSSQCNAAADRIPAMTTRQTVRTCSGCAILLDMLRERLHESTKYAKRFSGIFFSGALFFSNEVGRILLFVTTSRVAIWSFDNMYHLCTTNSCLASYWWL